jgi:hypothetical protein
MKGQLNCFGLEEGMMVEEHRMVEERRRRGEHLVLLGIASDRNQRDICFPY